jgi:hypothetical protein
MSTKPDNHRHSIPAPSILHKPARVLLESHEPAPYVLVVSREFGFIRISTDISDVIGSRGGSGFVPVSLVNWSQVNPRSVCTQ